MPKRAFTLRMSTFNAFLFLGSGVQLPFMPLWLKSEGLMEAEIALVMAAMMAIRVLAMPIGTYIADASGQRRKVVIVSAALAFACYASLYFINGYIPILIVAMMAAASFSPVGPLVEVLAIEGSTHYGIDYGRIRLWASLSFLAGNLIAGALLEVVPVQFVILLIAGAHGMGALMALVLPGDHAIAKLQSEAARVGDIFTRVMAPAIFVFAAAASIGQASHGMLYAMGSVNFDDMGFGKFTIGKLWAIAVVIEVTMFAFSSVFYKRFGAANLIVIGVACGVVRWMAMAFQPPLAVLYVAQGLHAGSFGLTHLGTMHYIRENVPENMRNTVQGLFSALSGGIVLAATMWASGPLYAAFGGAGYLAMAGCSLIALGLALMLRRINPRA